ncbi:hypothetical protein BJ944DRAFT_287735 [Cunninghamella echinulata]|nr:hypothetical protein BJ944DRAFT_287735 [Cunninghamella echinulata]
MVKTSYFTLLLLSYIALAQCAPAVADNTNKNTITSAHPAAPAPPAQPAQPAQPAVPPKDGQSTNPGDQQPTQPTQPGDQQPQQPAPGGTEGNSPVSPTKGKEIIECLIQGFDLSAATSVDKVFEDCFSKINGGSN